ncbi:MAG: NAD(P)-dependent oxidoreductase, partial [Alphaproteobacteria bacterium]
MSDNNRKLGVFPAFHKVRERAVIVIGGGAAAAAKISLLAETDARLHLYAPAVEPATAAALKAGGGTWQAR